MYIVYSLRLWKCTLFQNWISYALSMYIVGFMLMSNLISDLISDFRIASMLNHTIILNFGNKIYGMINMEAIPKFDIKSDVRFGNRFDIRIKQITWIRLQQADVSSSSKKINFIITWVFYKFEPNLNYKKNSIPSTNR